MNIVAERGLLRGIIGIFESRGGRPAAVVQTGDGIKLLSEEGIVSLIERAVVEKNRQNGQIVFVRNRQEDFQRFEEPVSFVFPYNKGQENAHAVVAAVRRPCQFAPDGRFVKRFLLPHFRGVDRRGGEIVHPHLPCGLFVPPLCLFGSPDFHRVIPFRKIQIFFMDANPHR